MSEPTQVLPPRAREPRQASGRVRIEVIEGADEFERLREHWADLRQRAAATVPFDSHRWLLAWWRAGEQVGVDRTHRVILAWDGERLVGALPIQVERNRFYRLPVSRATAMGAGWGANEILVAPEHAAEVAAALADALCGQGIPRWKVLRIAAWRGEPASQQAFLRRMAGQGCAIRETPISQPYLPLAASWEAYQAASSRNFRRTIKRKLQAMTEAGLVPRFARQPAARVLGETVESITKASWQGDAGLAVTATPFGRAFYARLAAASGEFDLDLVTLEHDGTPVAFLVGLLADGVYHAFETGFDPAWSEQSPGLTLHFLMLERLHAEGAREFDFGHAHGYKDRFEPETRALVDVRCFRSAWLGKWEDGAIRLEAWSLARKAARTARIVKRSAGAAETSAS